MARDDVWVLPPGIRSTHGTLNATLGRFVLTYVLTAGALAGFGLLWGEPGFEMLVVAMGWPHVLLGLLFYSRKLAPQGSPYRRPFFALLLLTLAISIAHTLVAITTFIYLYFVFHAFRDEIFMYRKRTRGFDFRGAVLDRGGLIFLASVLVVAGYDQIAQISWRPVDRSVTIPLSDLAGRTTLNIGFDPLENSAGRDFYFSLVVPGSSPPVALATYMTRGDSETSGEMLVNEKSVDGMLSEGSRHDLYFEPRFGSQTSSIQTPDDTRFAATALSGGHEVGQTFRAASDGLDGITLPIAWVADPPPGQAVEFTLQPATYIRFPFLEEASVLGLVLLGGGVVLLRSRGRDRAERREHIYFVVLVALLFLAKLALQVGRYYLLVAPLFFSFLVVFHYFSWYVFSLDTIRASGRRPNPEGGGWVDRLLGKMGDRPGFLKTVVLLNALSLAGVLAWAFLPGMRILDYAFRLDYFLYFLVFHVTMSFAPRTLSPARS
jgi:hypothetical protein